MKKGRKAEENIEAKRHEGRILASEPNQKENGRK